MKTYRFEAPVCAVEDVDGAYVVVPFDIPRIFGAGRIKVHARFDGEAYDGSIVSSKLPDGGKEYIIGIRKAIRAEIDKVPGDTVAVEFTCAQVDGPASLYYDALLAKVERKGREKDELDAVIGWLTGYPEESLAHGPLSRVSYARWLDEAPAYNPAASLIVGKVCGVNVAEVEDPIMHRVRVLDKLVDELAKGKPLAKVLRRA